MGVFSNMRAIAAKISEAPVISSVCNMVKNVYTAIKDRFGGGKDNNSPTPDTKQASDPTLDTNTMMSDIAALDHTRDYDEMIEHSMLNGLNSMCRNSDMDPKKRADLAAAVSSYSIQYDVEANKIKDMGSGQSNAMSAMDKAVAERVASQYNITTDELRKEYNAVSEETEKCQELIKKMGGGSIPQSELDAHPGLKALTAYNTAEKFSDRDFDVDKFVQSDEGKAWVESYRKDSSGAIAACNTDVRQQALVRAMVPALTEYVATSELDKAAMRSAQADAELSVSTDQTASQEVESGIDAVN